MINIFTIEDVIEIFMEYNNIAIPISILLSIGIALLGVLPSIFVTGANIVFFGPIMGFIISLIGETIGGYISFLIYRLGFKKSVESFKDKHRILKGIVESEGKEVGILIFEGRLIPFIPSGFVTLASAISSVKGGTFIIATLLGKIPSIALEALVSYDLINIEENFFRLGITVIAILIFFVRAKLKNKKKNKNTKL